MPNSSEDRVAAAKQSEATSSTQKPLPIPSISLPKGGGAIRGIGEKFAANPVTGTGSISVPIATSPGRSGFGPQLSLSYDSGAGNGLFGFGWSLDLPQITRKTDKGLPQYVDARESDVFLLSGTEDLVPVPNSEDTTSAPGYAIRRYRPRVEGLFARIERWTRAPDDVHWRAISRDDVLTIYGKDTDSRIVDPSDPRRIFSWLICESRDDKGNAIIYEYKREDAVDVDVNQPHERNRGNADSPLRKVNRYLKRVLYGNRAPLLDSLGRRPVDVATEVLRRENARWMFEIVLDYGEHDANVPRPDDDDPDAGAGKWLCRNDSFSNYRAGFEIRTYRLCQRILTFHHFPNEVGVGQNCLVRSADFAYRAARGIASDEQRGHPIASFLASATQCGYVRAADGGYTRQSMPPLTFEYSEAVIDSQVQTVDPSSLENLPVGLTGPAYHWVDLNGQGVPGILTDDAGSWYFKPNVGGGKLGPLQRVASRPTPANLVGSSQQLMDLGADGRLDLVQLGTQPAGFFERSGDNDWENFVPFASLPNVDWDSPELQLVDLTGDGLADLLISADDTFTWHPSLGEAGFGPAQRAAQPLDEERGPRLVLTDGTQTIFLADMSGDGLTDLVRIRNGEVCYWPNLGYGRFGARVTMDRAPWFDRPDQFDPRRIRLADVDGSGVVDILYAGGSESRLWFNQSGNSWSESRRLPDFPHADSYADVQVVDLLGNGTACIVWSSPLPFDTRESLRYIDLMGGTKPHLLVRVDNNLGAETRIGYAASTKFYLADREAGRPWITRLPFPVHVVERVERIDHVSGTRFSERYAYHHGYFDGIEREFRGFGMVEQEDTEAFEDYVIGVRRIGGTQEDTPELYQPPVTTRTWFHTGAYLDEFGILHQLRNEYYLRQQHVPEPILPLGLDADELREAVRALKGLPLREEVYSFDGSAKASHPFSVVENNYDIKLVQARAGQRHAVFFPYGCETVTHYYERDSADPRIAHTLNLQVGPYGNVEKSAVVVYGRRIANAALPVEVTRDQQRLHVSYAETDYTPDIDEFDPVPAYRLRTPYESRRYEITGIAPDAERFTLTELAGKIAMAGDIAYEDVATDGSAQKRPLSQSRTLFRDNSLAPLGLGQWDTLGLVYESYQLAFTPSVVTAHYSRRISDSGFAAAGYVHFAGDTNWWIRSGAAVYPANPATHFFLPIGAKDALGLETTATLDKYDLLVERVRVTQAPWNNVSAVNDYRVLGPVMITDPNQNRTAVEIDALGLVVKSAVMGKVGANEGDTLGDPTVRMEYQLSNWRNHRKPNFVHTFAREKHGVTNPRWQESYAYSNGTGSVAMVKAQAHPGAALRVNNDGSVTELNSDPRWLGTGGTVLNNKGNLVKQYEPYFSTTHEYEDAEALRHVGTTSIRFYDAVGRNIRTLFANGTFARVEFDPWTQKVFDASDTVKESQWYADRGSPDPATEPEPVSDPERRAAWLTAKHAGTPGFIHSDSLDRSVYAISDLGGGKTAAVRSESDLTGRFSRLFDQERREVASAFIGMAGTSILSYSAEKGRRWTFQNVLGALVQTWDEHGRQFRVEYDQLHRPVSTFVQEPGQVEILFNYVVYGDRHPNAAQLNLLGTAHQVFDQAGLVQVPELDFKGNPKRVERILAKQYKQNLDWKTLAAQSSYAAVQASANPALELSEVFVASSLYDALNRPTQMILPDGTLILPTYNEANFLSSLQAKIRGQGTFREFLKHQDYDAKGQRRFAQYGNGVITRYVYDSTTFRLTNLLTYKSGDDPDTEGLQNLRYTYDPVGNITQIRDDAQQTLYFNNAVVKPEFRYEYDATYQLVRATGREHAGFGNDAVRTEGDLGVVSQLPHSNDVNAVRTYSEEYEYDLLGNLKVLRHRFQPQVGAGNGWSRYYRYAYEDDANNRTNRLSSTSLSGDPDAGPYSATYDYDDYGNMTRMPHLANLLWNFTDQLRQVNLGGGGTAYCVYGQGGQRVRKVIERNGDTKLEWIFLGALMLFRRRRRSTDALRLERSTVHIGDNTGNIAQVDIKIRDDDNSDAANPLDTPLSRYQYANHLGAAIETDDSGNVISYEEYHPFGTSAYRSTKPGVDLSLKRFRFSGKERDDETGLYYFGARYYASWLGRWTSGDPEGFVDGFNQFQYCRNNPIALTDPDGLKAAPRQREKGGAEVRREKPFTGKETRAQLDQIARDAGYRIKGDPSWEEGYGWRAELEPIGQTSGGGQESSKGSTEEPRTAEPQQAADEPAADESAASVEERRTDPPPAAETTEEPRKPDKPPEQEEGFWSSIVSGKEEAGFWKGLIPVVGSVQNANYHFAKGNWGRGILYTALAITDVFLVRSLVTGAVKLAARGVVALKGVGQTLVKELAPNQGIGSGTNLVTKLKRLVVQDLATYQPSASVVFRVLRQHFQISTKKGLQSMFEMHHWLIQQGWFKGANAVNNPLLRQLLRRLGNSGWNLIPIPGPINNALGKSALATVAFAQKLFDAVSAEFEWTANNLQQLLEIATAE